MTRGKRTQAPELEVTLLREGIVESRHRAQAAVCDNRGRVLSVAGNSETASFVRSSLKPFQALAVTATGTLERYELTDRDLAIICSSHQGTIEQSRQVFNVLWRCDIDPSKLQCPIPEREKERPAIQLLRQTRRNAGCLSATALAYGNLFAPQTSRPAAYFGQSG